MRWAYVAVAMLGACGAHVVPSVRVPSVQPAPDARVRGWILHAYRAEALEDGEEAERAWGWVRRLDPDGATFHGEWLLRSGRVDEAEQAFLDGLLVEPRDDRAHDGMCRVRVARGQLTDDALQADGRCRAR